MAIGDVSWRGVDTELTDKLASELDYVQTHNMPEKALLDEISAFGDAKYTPAYDWIEEQVWRVGVGYEHQGCIALAKIDYEKAVDLINEKIVESKHKLNDHARRPFTPSTLGKILANLYDANPRQFVDNYKKLRGIDNNYLKSALMLIKPSTRNDIAYLLSSYNCDSSACLKECLR